MRMELEYRSLGACNNREDTSSQVGIPVSSHIIDRINGEIDSGLTNKQHSSEYILFSEDPKPSYDSTHILHWLRLALI